MEVVVMDPVKVIDIIRKYETYKLYPFVYYINLDGATPEISEIPGKQNIKVEAYTVNVGPYILVLQFIGDTPIMDAFEYRIGMRAVDVTKPLDYLYSFINGRLALSLTPHERQGVGRLFFLDESEVEKIEQQYQLRKVLRDRRVAIVGDEVYVFSKEDIFQRVDGEMAVELAKKISFPAKHPVSEIVEQLSKAVKGKATLFSLIGRSLLCTRHACRVIPLSSRVVKLLQKKLPDRFNVLLMDSESPPRNGKITLPDGIDAVAFSKRGIYLMRKIENQRYEIVKNFKVPTRFNVPIVYGKYGFIGYGKVELLRGVAYIRKVNIRPERDNEAWEYEAISTVI